MTTFENQTVTMLICKQCHREYPRGETVCPIDGEALIPAGPDPLIGTIVAERYELLERVGGGGISGAVYKSRQQDAHALVSIRIFTGEYLTDASAAQRFESEAKALAALRHPHILPVVDFGLTDKSQPYVVTGYLEETILGDFLHFHGRMELRRALQLFVQAADGMAYAHHQGILHGGLNPGNLMIVEERGQPEQLRLVDLGVGRLQFTQEQPESKILDSREFETPLYMSPEHCDKKPLDQRSDLYSLACIMYHTITGMPPLVGLNAAETMAKQRREQPLPLKGAAPELDIPDAIDAAIMKALHKNPADRQHSVAEFTVELVESARKLGIYVAGAEASEAHKHHRTEQLTGFVGQHAPHAPHVAKPAFQEPAAADHEIDFLEQQRQAQQHKMNKLVEHTAVVHKQHEQQKGQLHLLLMTVAGVCLLVLAGFAGHLMLPGPAEDPAPNWQKELWRMDIQASEKDLEAKNYDSAAKHLNDAIQIGHSMGPGYDNEIRAWAKLLSVYDKSGNTAEAEKVRERIVSLHFDRVKALYGHKNFDDQTFAAYHSGFLRSGEAKKMSSEFIDTTSRSLIEKTRACIKNKQFQEAQIYMNEAVALREQAPGNNNGELAKCAGEFQAELASNESQKRKLKDIDRLLAHAQEIGWPAAAAKKTVARQSSRKAR